jgi:hypothetical protein
VQQCGKLRVIMTDKGELASIDIEKIKGKCVQSSSGIARLTSDNTGCKAISGHFLIKTGYNL